MISHPDRIVQKLPQSVDDKAFTLPGQGNACSYLPEYYEARSDIVAMAVLLGGVDKFEPVSGGGEMHHSEEAVGQLVISGSDGPVDLELPEHALDAIALLVERPIMFDFHAAV